MENKSVDFSSVIISKEKIETIESAMAQLKYNDLIFDTWGFSKIFEKGTAVSMIFFGIPGTGKTLMAQAIANKLNEKLLVVGPAEIETSVPGGAERNIKKYFGIAEGTVAPQKLDENGQPIFAPNGVPVVGQKTKHVLLFDECDSLITDRGKVGMIIAGQINTLLSELERFTGVIIFTTNRLGQLDPAIERRISVKVDFPFPNKEQRERIWERMIPREAPIDKDVNYKKLSEVPLTGGNIKNVVLAAARIAAYNRSSSIKLDYFLDAIEKEIEG